MEPGLYVVRMPANGAGSRLIVETRPFRFLTDEQIAEAGGDRASADRYTRHSAETYRKVFQQKHPKDDVFIIERKAD